METARQEATAALPHGWELGRPDNERYNSMGIKVDTASAAAHGPAGEVVMAIDAPEVRPSRAGAHAAVRAGASNCRYATRGADRWLHGHVLRRVCKR
jgi:hypothetical protein